MLKKIERNDPIFKSELFFKDIISFNIMISIVEDLKNYPSPKIFSNGSDCIIVNSDSEHPVLIWTDDTFDDFENLHLFIHQEFSENKPFKFISKSNFFEYLLNKKKINLVHRKDVGSYRCQSLNDIKYVGFPDNAKPEEIMTVATLLSVFDEESNMDNEVEIEKYVIKAQEYVTNPLNQVWRNTEGKIVALTKLNISEKYARISNVVTSPDERGKSYAKMLVHFMTNYAKSLEKMPVLYTDYNYSASNKCYLAVGYEPLSTLVEFEVGNI